VCRGGDGVGSGCRGGGGCCWSRCWGSGLSSWTWSRCSVAFGEDVYLIGYTIYFYGSLVAFEIDDSDTVLVAIDLILVLFHCG